MKFQHALSFVIVGLGLAGCAGSVATPVAVQPLTVDQKLSLHVSDVTTDAASGVDASDSDLDTITQKIKADFQSEHPGVLVDAGAPQADKLRVHITRFDRGNAFARGMLIGMGQIHIEGSVDIRDAAGSSIGQYNVSKDFAIGGLIGASTTVEDVEDGFAKSVVAVVDPKS